MHCLGRQAAVKVERRSLVLVHADRLTVIVVTISASSDRAANAITSGARSSTTRNSFANCGVSTPAIHRPTNALIGVAHARGDVFLFQLRRLDRDPRSPGQSRVSSPPPAAGDRFRQS
jgi:hypothetical protein